MLDCTGRRILRVVTEMEEHASAQFPSLVVRRLQRTMGCGKAGNGLVEHRPQGRSGVSSALKVTEELACFSTLVHIIAA